MTKQAIIVGLDMRLAGNQYLAEMGGFLCGRPDALIESKWNWVDLELASIQKRIWQAKSAEERYFWVGYRKGWLSVVRPSRKN